MLAAAAGAGRSLTVYQSRRWDPDFVALRRTVESGAVGKPFHLESFIGGYGHPCSYWHSHEPISGGTIFDWGSHYFDWTLLLFREQVETVSAVAQTLVWQDVTNSDHVNVDLRFADGTQASFLHSDIATALKPKWYLLGTGGAIVGDWRQEAVVARGTMDELVEDRLAPADSPATVIVVIPSSSRWAYIQARAVEQSSSPAGNGWLPRTPAPLRYSTPTTTTPVAASSSRNRAYAGPEPRRITIPPP